jgi:hypothetical protein
MGGDARVVRSRIGRQTTDHRRPTTAVRPGRSSAADDRVLLGETPEANRSDPLRLYLEIAPCQQKGRQWILPCTLNRNCGLCCSKLPETLPSRWRIAFRLTVVGVNLSRLPELPTRRAIFQTSYFLPLPCVETGLFNLVPY